MPTTRRPISVALTAALSLSALACDKKQRRAERAAAEAASSSYGGARSPSRSSATARPPAPLQGCAPGERSAEGIALTCGHVRLVWGPAAPGVRGRETALLQGFEETMRQLHGDAYASQPDRLELGRVRLRGLMYQYTERVQEHPPRDVTVAGRYLITHDEDGHPRAIHCAGAPGDVAARCADDLREIARRGPPAHLRPEGNEEGRELVPRVAGRALVVPSGCQTSPDRLTCGDVMLYWRHIEPGQAPDLEERFAEAVVAGARLQLGQAELEPAECALADTPATCRALTILGPGGEPGRALIAWARPGGQRVLAMCAWPEAAGEGPGAVCEQLLQMR